MKTWTEFIALAPHFLAIGEGKVYLNNGDNGRDRPWHLVTKCEPGSSHRLEISTGVWFYAAHPSGLTFCWSFDIEPFDASGSGSYQIDVGECKKALALLPAPARAQFQAYLGNCADAVGAKAIEWREIADRQTALSEALRKLARDQ